MFKKLIISIILITFFLTTLGPIPDLFAQSLLDLPAPGLMVQKSIAFEPLQLKGILVNAKNPLRFDFLVDRGDSTLYGQALKDEIVRLSKYFLTCLAVPEDDLWVNLSPYERERIVPGNFGITLMGKDLLEQDYMLKQIMASLSYPENDLGRKFWQRVYDKAYQLYGTTDIPINTFNKVWIVPDSADVYAQGNGAFVVKSSLNVMLEADYKSFVHHAGNQSFTDAHGFSQNAGAYSQIYREVIFPELRQEINEGKNFAPVRQVYNAMILATWYKHHLKDSLLGKLYVGRNQVKGVDIVDKDTKEKIYRQYLKAYKKCVYNYIKDDFDPATQQTIPRKYASGGMYFAAFGKPDSKYREVPNPRGMRIGTRLSLATVFISATNANGTKIEFPYWKAVVMDDHPFHEIAEELQDDEQRTVVNLGSRAMLVPKSLRPLLLSLVLAVGGLVMTSPMAAAAQQHDDLDSLIKQRQEKIYQLEHQYSKDYIIGMHAGERGMWQGKIRYNEGVLEKLKAQKLKAQEQKEINVELKMVADVTIHQVVPNALASGIVAPVVKVAPLVTPGPKAVEPPKAITPSAAPKTVQPEPIVTPPAVSKTAEPSAPAVTPAPAITPIASVPTAMPVAHAPDQITSVPQDQRHSPVGQIQFLIFANTASSPIQFTAPTFNQQLGVLINVPPSLIKMTIPSRSTSSTVASGGKPPKPSHLALLTPMWPLYAGIGVMGVGLGGLWAARAQSKKKKAASDAISLQTSPPARPVGLIIESAPPRVETTPEELARLPQLKAQLQKVLTDNKGMVAIAQKIDRPKRSLSDTLSWISGMALAASTYAFNPVSLLASAVVLPVVNAIYATGNAWLHEMGHILAAAILYPLPRHWQKLLTADNFKGHLTFSQWKELFTAKLLGNEYTGANPYVAFPASGWRDRVISFSGIFSTVAINTIALSAAYWAAIDNNWLMPLLGVMGVNTYTAIKSALIGDIRGSIASKNNKIYPCGISVHNRIIRRNALAVMGYKAPLKRLEEMMRTEGDRGVHEAGAMSMIDGEDGQAKKKEKQITETAVMTMLPGEDGKVSVPVAKSIEALRGPKKDSIGQAVEKLEDKLPVLPVDAANGNEYVMFTLIGHNRLASGGLVEEDAAHPHIGPIHRKVLWSLARGILVEGNAEPLEMEVDIARPPKSENDNPEEDNVAAGAAHNGDGDAYQPLEDDDFIEDLDELRAFAIQSVHFQGELPPGDSPVIPLLIQFHLTQGNPDASVRFAHMRTHYKKLKELNSDGGAAGWKTSDLLNEDEEIVAGEVFDRGIRKFGAILSRPAITHPDKSIKDLYVSEEMARANLHDEQIQFQYQALGHLKDYLVEQFKKEALAGTLPEKMAKHWRGQDADAVIRKFVELAVYKFFTGDRDTACHEFEGRSKGTYGLAVKVSTDLNGLTLLSRKLGMVYGYNLEKGYLDASSDPYALLKKYANGDQLKTLMFLDPKGKGEMANFHVSKVTGELSVRIFSLQMGRYLTDQEIFEREYPLTPDNKFFRPMHEYRSEKTRIIEDMEVVTPKVAELVESLDEQNSSKPPEDQEFNYRSGMKMFRNLMAFWISRKFDDKMLKGGVFHVIHQKVMEKTADLEVECMAQSCSEGQMEFLRTEAASSDGNSILMFLFSRWLHQEAIDLAAKRLDGSVAQTDLRNEIDVAIERRSQELLSYLTLPRISELYTLWKQEREHPFSGKEKIGMLFAGDENSDSGPRSVEDSWNALFPYLPKRFVSSHELLDYNSIPFDITSPWVTVLTSKAGGNFNTMQALDIMLNSVGEENVWGATGRPDSPLSVAMGQRLRPDSPFLGHVFYTGDHYRAQTQGASETLTSALHNLLPVFIALQFEKFCPGEHPFGLNLTLQRSAYLKRLMHEMMLADSKRITGRDKDGDQVKTKVNDSLFKRSQFLARRLWETPMVLWTTRIFDYLIFLGGPFILGWLQYFGYIPGPALNSWKGFTIATADYLLAMFAPWLFTLLYRKMSKYIPWVLQGPPANINVVGKGAVPEIQEMFLRVAFSRSFVNWGTQVLSATYEKAIARLGPSAKRGSWIFAHIPSTFLKRNAVGAVKQLKVTKVGLGGTKIKRTGAISFTTSRGPYNDPKGVVSDYNVDLEGTEFLPPKGDNLLSRVYNNFDAWGANLAFKKVASDMIYILTFGGLLWLPKKVNNALSLTTESGQQPPEKLPMDRAQITLAVEQKSFGSKGGIDMSSRLMHLNISGENQNRLGRDDAGMTSVPIQGAVPEVSGVVTVTPDMLKTMLGQAYMN